MSVTEERIEAVEAHIAMNYYLEKKLQLNPDGTISFGKSAIDHASGIDIGKRRTVVRHASPELRKRIEKYVSETRNLADDMTAKK